MNVVKPTTVSYVIRFGMRMVLNGGGGFLSDENRDRWSIPMIIIATADQLSVFRAYAIYAALVGHRETKLELEKN